MATVTSFQALSHPTRSELRQFAELFQPMFAASSLEARREAVAALSQSESLPMAIAAFIASQPISVAAPFLAASPALSDELLIMIARTQGADHARAIVKREKLSPTVIDALVGLRHADIARPDATTATDDEAAAKAFRAEMAKSIRRLPIQAAQSHAAGEPELWIERREPEAGSTNRPTASPLQGIRDNGREEELRQQIKRLAHHLSGPASDRLGRRTASQVQTALLVRFARTREGGHFATTLADLLSSSRWLAERILTDISGRQLATTLVGVAMAEKDTLFILEQIYPHLARSEDGVSRAERLITELDTLDCEARIESWRRADSYTFGRQDEDASADAVTGKAGIQVVSALNSAASQPAAMRKPVGDEHGRQVLRARKR